MAANSRSKATTWADGEQVDATQFEVVESNAAKAIARASTNSGAKQVNACFIGKGATAGLGPFVVSGSYRIPTSLSGTRVNYSFEIPCLPHGQSLTAFSVRYTPAAGHTTNPGLLPRATLYSVRTTSATVLGTASTTWTNTATYHAGTTLTMAIATAARTLSGEARYVLQFGNEGGADSTGTVKVNYMAASVTFDTSSGGADLSFWK